MTKKRFLLALALMLTAVGGAWAQGEVLLTTITATAQEQASYSTANVANVSFSYTANGSSAYHANWGWWGYGWIATVTPAEGYTITKCIFYDDANRTATDSEAPFVVETTEEDKTPQVNGTPIQAYTSRGIKKIDVYGYVTPAAPEPELLVKDNDTLWHLTVPAGNVTLTVDYYGQYTLDSVPTAEGWQVKVNGTARTVTPYTEGNTALGHVDNINETDSVELIPPAELKDIIKSVTLVNTDVPPTVDLDNTTTAWADGSNFAVPAGGLTYGDAVTVSGNVTLTLTEGTTLTLNKGISLASGATLTVEGNGTMNVNGTNNNTSSTVAGTGTIVLTSGTLNAKGGNGQGVGDRNTDTDVRANAGGNAINGNVTVSGGMLTATGGNGGGVGERSAYSYGAAGGEAISGSVTVTGGAVTATGGNGGSIGNYGAREYGGAGGAAIGGDATISGGTWTATDGTHGVNGDGQGGAGGQAVAGTVTDNR